MGQRLSGFKGWVNDCQGQEGGSATVRIQRVSQRLSGFRGWAMTARMKRVGRTADISMMHQVGKS